MKIILYSSLFSKRPLLLCAITAITCGISGPTLHAQEQTLALEEVVVQARRRQENMQNVPIAVTAFQGDDLEIRDISDISQFSDLAPNVTLKPTASLSGASNAAAFFIRGIGQTDFAITTDPGVASYVDGVYIARSVGGLLDTLDVQSIEILRGPQGTLFGRNTIGGAINITTRRPAQEFSGDIRASVGSRNRRDIAAAIDLPISETLTSRVSFLSRKQDGYVQRLLGYDNAGNIVATGDKSNASALSDKQGNKNSQTFRATFEYSPSEALNFLLVADSTDVDEESAASTAVISSTGFVPSSALTAIEIPGLGLVAPGDRRLITDDIDSTYATGPNGTQLQIKGLALTTTYETDFAQIKSITAQRSTKGNFNRDGDATPFPIGEQTRKIKYDQFSQELQLNGTAFNDKVQWTIGAYYFHEESEDLVLVSLGNLFGQPPSIDIDNFVENESIALFAQSSTDISDLISLTTGIRWTSDEKKYRTRQQIPSLNLLVVDGQSRRRFNDVTGRLSIDFQLSDTHLVYAAVSSGFKSGGFTPRYVAPVEKPLSFDPEIVLSYELGSKWQGLDNRIQINSALFYADYEDIQLVLFDVFGAPINQNGGDATIWGVESELTFVVNGNFRISATAGYINAGFDTVLEPRGGAVFQPVTVNSTFPNTPEFQASISPEFNVAIDNHIALSWRLDIVYSSKVYQNFENDTELLQDAYTMIDTSIILRNEKDDWSISLGAHNLSDKRIISSGGIGRAPGFGDVNYNAPRELYLTLRKGF